MFLREEYYPRLYIPPKFLKLWDLQPNELIIKRKDISIPEVTKFSAHAYYKANEVVSGTIAMRGLSDAEFRLALTLPVLLDMTAVSQEQKHALERVAGGILDNSTNASYLNLRETRALIHPNAPVIAPHIAGNILERGEWQ